MSVLSLGLIETRGLVAAIEAADAAAKAASVALLSAELLGGGIVTLRLQGDLGAVQAAVDAGAQAAKRIGEVIAVRVIPRPVGELSKLSTGSRSLRMADTSIIQSERTHDSKRESHTPTVSEAPPVVKQTPRKTKPTPAKSHTPTTTTRTLQVEPPPTVVAPTTVHHAPATVSRSQYDFAELEAMSVVRLRQFARSVNNLGIQGRQISMANKAQLLDAIRNAANH
jgi:microcompartment protein CcmL/EutN